MATRPLSPAFVTPVRAGSALVLAVAIPPLFLHADFQPGLSLGRVAVRLSDVAVLAVLAAAVADGRSRGFDVLRGGRWLWLAAGALSLWVLAASVYGGAITDGFPIGDKLVAAAKFVEYALLAPAVALIVRGRDDLRPLATACVIWAAVAVVAGLVQFAGGDIFDAWPAGGRQPSLLGHHDFAALAGGTFLLGVGLLVLEGRRRLLAVVAGAVGLVLAGPLAALLGLGIAFAALLLLARRVRPYPVRRAAVAAALTAAIAMGMLAMRGESVSAFFRFLADDEPTAEIETYSHRTVLAYIGLRIFLDHPVVGVGFQGSTEPAAFGPYVDDARERFPDAAPLAFPSPERRYGVQSLYVQTLADLGLVGFAWLLAVFAAGLALAIRDRRTAAGALGLLWLLLAAGIWSAQGLVAGLPLAALTWIALGLAASRSEVSDG